MSPTEMVFTTKDFKISCSILIRSCSIFTTIYVLGGSRIVLRLLFDCYDKLISESSNTSFIVAGDFNPATNRFQPKYIEKQCHQIVKEPTRGANILDLIFTNIREFYESPKILAPIATSDHSTIVWNSKSWQPKKNATRKLRVKPLRPGAVLAFGEFLKCNWSSLLSITDVNNKVDAFLKFTHDSIDSFFPTKTVKIYEEDKPFVLLR